MLSILSLVTGFLYGYSLVFYSFVWACIYFGAYMTGPEVKSEKKLTNSFFFSSSGSQDRTRVVERLRPLSHLVGLGSQRVPLAFRHWSHFTFIACHFICAPRG